ncbi:lectin-like domain-containing protein [Companilactobacillus muriivasis]|uniref:lectin-like domain-containing protein n=1 Tax=Companilactobacillus muriivasis TaxID=3081444 RepID=UPI0030C73378
MNEQTAGLNTAPKENLGLDSTLFTKGDFSDYKTSSGGTWNNMASLMKAQNTDGDDVSAIRMTYNTGQAAAIWSNVAGGNYIDITKKQTLSMWLYFGPKTHEDSGGFGDGMAFVLQNSDLGVKAFSHKGTKLGVGETLGVWGMDNDKTVSSSQSIADTAIGRSWALEFDTHTNSTGALDGADGFDTGISGQHIAYGYPDDPDTYPKEGSQPKYGIFGTYLSGGYYYTQNHSGIKSVDLHDGNWHHLTISWDPTTFQATYSFNDKNRDGSKGTNPITETTEPIKPTEFGKVPNNHLRWGFTATTGDSYEANLIAFESIPSQVEGDATATIKDVTQNKDVKDGDSVNSNDQLAMNYNLTYDSGSDSWKNIVADLNLPSGVTYTADSNGNIGRITYSDGSTEDIKSSFLSGTSVNGYPVDKSLSSTGPTSATITINGVASAVNQETPVASTRSKIDSDTLIKDVDSPSFNIEKSRPINLSLDKNNVPASPDKDVGITGTVSYTDGTAVTNSDVSVYAKLKDNDTGMETTLDTFPLSSDDASGKLNFSIPADKLTGTTNDLEVYVMDKDGNKSTTSTEVISKTGALSLTVNKGYNFSNVNQVTASHLITRSGNWDITVNDGRPVSQKNVWQLSAETKGLKIGDGGTPFNGEMVYKDNNGNEQSLMGDNLVDIANGVKTQDGEQTTSVSKTWNSSTGIFLRSNGLMTAGKYTGDINWTLSDTL